MAARRIEDRIPPLARERETAATAGDHGVQSAAMITRRSFLGGSLAVMACGKPRRSPPAPLPLAITHGVQAGDPSAGRAFVWSRGRDYARMFVEWDTTDRFSTPQRLAGPIVNHTTDFAGRVTLAGLPDAQTIFYRVKFEREAAKGTTGWVTGRLRTPRADRVRVAWTGDTCGQWYGRNDEWGGLKGFAAIRAAQPDVFINSGDLIYADNPIVAERKGADGRVWKNVTNEYVARVAQTLPDFRARFAYNFEDEHVRALAADVAVIAQWDDHETRNNWWPGQLLEDPRYQQRDATILARHALQATREWTPIGGPTVHRVIHYGPLLDVFVLDCRSFRTPNDANTGDAKMLGDAQVDWLLRGLAASRARWKVIACDQPIGLVIPDDDRHEGFANGAPGAPSGRERELATLLERMKGTKNVVWVTADVHYAAAHHFDPARGSGVDFDPFWEFIAGPIHAGSFGPNPLDPTLGPEVRFQWVPPDPEADLGPADGMQNFGTLDVTPEALTATLWGIDGKQRFQVAIENTLRS
jgi:alkaline phosphatase D